MICVVITEFWYRICVFISWLLVVHCTGYILIRCRCSMQFTTRWWRVHRQWWNHSCFGTCALLSFVSI